jgi:ABC-type multidrug transport system fused ATPase/permease subunit
VVRQVESLISKEFGENKEKVSGIDAKQMRRYASSGEMFLLYSGLFASFLVGCCMPLVFSLLGDLFSNFNLSPGEQLEQARWICGIQIGIGILNFILGSIKGYCLNRFSISNVFKIRIAYYKAILSQDNEWYDLVNASELAPKLGA